MTGHKTPVYLLTVFLFSFFVLVLLLLCIVSLLQDNYYLWNVNQEQMTSLLQNRTTAMTAVVHKAVVSAQNQAFVVNLSKTVAQ